MSTKLCSIGDIMLGENVHHFRRGIATRFRNNYQKLVSPEINSLINQGDIVLGNFECSLMPDKQHEKAPMSRAIYAAPESALKCFDNWHVPIVLNLANNHFGQHGKESVEYTIKCLNKRGIKYIGLKKTPLVLDIGKNKIFLWGASLVEDSLGKDYVFSCEKNLIRDLEWGDKPDGAFWILSIHWGKEYMTQAEPAQRELANKLAEKGVDLILGHHPHVIQPVKYETGIPVAYSHGNFIFDQNFSKLTQTGLMTITELDTKKIQCYKLFAKKFAVTSCNELSINALEAFCRKKFNFYNPLLMRFLMKAEMVRNAYKVPKRTWYHFAKQLLKKSVKIF